MASPRRGSARDSQPLAGRSTGRSVERLTLDGVEVEIRRSAKRRRTVSAYRQQDLLVVLVPASLSRAEETRWVRTMIERVARSESRTRTRRSDEALVQRATNLSRTYLRGAAVPSSVRWVSNQNGRWGSCTPLERTIRISDKLAEMPDWVIDYVLLHELAHLIEPGHGADFWRLLEGYPKLERARGYLQGVSDASGLTITED